MTTRRFPLFLLPLLLLGPAAVAQTPDTPANVEADGLKIGTKVAPPFVMKSADGVWHGLSIDLWRAVTDRLGLVFEIEEKDLQDLLDGVESGELDAAVAALTVTAEREAVLDFTHPFHTSGLGIATRADPGGWRSALGSLVSTDFLGAILPLGALLLLVGLVVWLFERRRNEEFGGSWLQGLGSGFWWSAVTMTTVGYGDKSPRTFGGRLIALVWMFASVIAISGFTATIATALTLRSLESPVESAADLPQVRVGTVAASTSETWLSERGIGNKTFPGPEKAIDALEAGRVDAVVYDRPILQWLVSERTSGLRILPDTLERQDYGIALPSESPLRESLNRAILETITSAPWRDTRARYLGGDDG